MFSNKLNSVTDAAVQPSISVVSAGGLLLWLDAAGSEVAPPPTNHHHHHHHHQHPPVNKCIFFVWSQYFPPRQWRLLFRPWLLSKLTWLNWLRANELLDWSCQAPQEVMLLHLWGATPATAAICCLGLSQGLKKKKKKSQNYRKYLRRCVYSDQLSVMTHSDEHAHAKATRERDRQTSTYTHCNFCIMVSNVTFKGARVGPRRYGGKSEWSRLPC